MMGVWKSSAIYLVAGMSLVLAWCLFGIILRWQNLCNISGWCVGGARRATSDRIKDLKLSQGINIKQQNSYVTYIFHILSLLPKNDQKRVFDLSIYI